MANTSAAAAIPHRIRGSLPEKLLPWIIFTTMLGRSRRPLTAVLLAASFAVGAVLPAGAHGCAQPTRPAEHSGEHHDDGGSPDAGTHEHDREGQCISPSWCAGPPPPV